MSHICFIYGGAKYARHESFIRNDLLYGKITYFATINPRQDFGVMKIQYLDRDALINVCCSSYLIASVSMTNFTFPSISFAFPLKVS